MPGASANTPSVVNRVKVDFTRHFCNLHWLGERHYDVRMATQVSVRTIKERAIFRRWQRFRLNLPIRLVVTRDKKTQITEGRANDISDGGVLVFAGMELKSGDSVFVEFTPPFSNDPVRARGIVRHRRGYNYGIEFLGQTTGEREEIEKFRTLLRMSAGNTPA